MAGVLTLADARVRLMLLTTAPAATNGIPTITDRVVQAALKLVLEPIFEADFQPVSYGFVRHEVRGIEGGGRPSRCVVAAM